MITGVSAICRNIGFAPDGRRVVTSSDDHTTVVWDAATGKAVAILDAGSDYLHATTVSPNGRFLVTGSEHPHTLRLWRLFPIDAEELVDAAKLAVPRCLTSDQRNKFFLDPDPPTWCIGMKKMALPDGAVGTMARGQESGQAIAAAGRSTRRHLY